MVATDTLTDFELVKIADIEIGERFRVDPTKDVDKLAQSIDDIGLLNPVVLTSALELVAGHRRILACQSLGRDEIEAHFVRDLDEAAKLMAEHDENVCRVQMTTGEARACAKARTALLAPEAKENKAANLKNGKEPTRSVSGSKPQGDTRELAAVGTGKSGKTIERANKIEEIATDPETPPEVAELATEVLAKVDNDEMPVNTGLETVKAKQAEVAEYRGQSKALKSVVTAAGKHAQTLVSVLLDVDGDDYKPVENFDSDLTIDDVKAAAKALRASFALINKTLKMVGA